MNKQYVEGIQNGKKGYFTSVDNIVLWLYRFSAGPETASLVFKELWQKEVDNGFLTVMWHYTVKYFHITNSLS